MINRLNEKIMETLIVSSEAFEENSLIPEKYTCDGEEVSPPFDVDHIPETAKTLAIIMEDPDAISGIYDHWLKWDIPVTGSSMSFRENEEPEGTSGKNSGGNLDYQGPCPPDGEHRYLLKIYALDTKLGLPEGSTREELERIMDGHIVATGELLGTYTRELESDEDLDIEEEEEFD